MQEVFFLLLLILLLRDEDLVSSMTQWPSSIVDITMNNIIVQEGEDCEDKDKTLFVKLGPEVATFLKTLLNMTQCPISHVRFT